MWITYAINIGTNLIKYPLNMEGEEESVETQLLANLSY